MCLSHFSFFPIISLYHSYQQNTPNYKNIGNHHFFFFHVTLHSQKYSSCFYTRNVDRHDSNLEITIISEFRCSWNIAIACKNSVVEIYVCIRKITVFVCVWICKFVSVFSSFFSFFFPRAIFFHDEINNSSTFNDPRHVNYHRYKIIGLTD